MRAGHGIRTDSGSPRSAMSRRDSKSYSASSRSMGLGWSTWASPYGCGRYDESHEAKPSALLAENQRARVVHSRRQPFIIEGDGVPRLNRMRVRGTDDHYGCAGRFGGANAG
jgi:hypothetical protein